MGDGLSTKGNQALEYLESKGIRFRNNSGVAFELDETNGQIKVVVASITNPDISGYVRVDGSTESWNIVDYAHHEIHGGSSYSITNATDIANNASVQLLVVTPDTTKFPHITFESECEAEMDYTIYEDCTVAASGTELTPRNRNRNSGDNSTLSVYINPTHVTLGTELYSQRTGAGNKVGGAVREQSEWILKRNTLYLFKVLNQSGQTRWASAKFDWYEHTDKN